jgi:hypothetical protein
MSAMRYEMRERDSRKPNRKELRAFGLVISSIIVGLFGLLFPWMLDMALGVGQLCSRPGP